MAFSAPFDLVEMALGGFCELIQDDDGFLAHGGMGSMADGLQCVHTGTESLAGAARGLELRSLLHHPQQCTAAGTQLDTAARNLSSSSLLSDHSAVACGGNAPTLLTGASAGSPTALHSAASLAAFPVPGTATAAGACPQAQQLPHPGNGQGSHAGSPPSSSLLEDDDLDAISRPPASYSCSEKQRRDRLNSLIARLATIVPPCNGSEGGNGSAGGRRAKHTILMDTIRAVRTLQQQVAQQQRMLQCAAQNPGSSANGATASHDAGAVITGNCTPSSAALLEFPLPLDIPANNTGVMVEADAGSMVWLLRVTCRDRPGLLGDVAAALRNLPLSIRSASLTTTRDGKAQQVFEVQVTDASLAPEEVQCAVNAALYAHLLATQAQGSHQPPAKRARLV